MVELKTLILTVPLTLLALALGAAETGLPGVF